MAEAEITDDAEGESTNDERPDESDPNGSDSESREPDGGSVTATVDGDLTIPAAADGEEAAAIATAVGAHLHDRAVAAAAATSETEPERTDAWKLAGRMKSVGKRRWPNDVPRGEEWKAAARSFY